MSSTRAIRSLWCFLPALWLAAIPAAAHREVIAPAEVVHYWTSSSEAAALRVIVDAYRAHGGSWQDVPVPGFAAAKAMTQIRVAARRPPAAMSWVLGASLSELDSAGLLADVQDSAQRWGWGAHLPPLIAHYAARHGRLIAAPINIHITNWMWLSRRVLTAAQVAPPASWQEFLRIAPRLQAMGYIPLALGGQPWQEAYLFDSVLMDVAGREYYQRVFVDLDEQALSSPILVEVFARFLALKPFVDAGSPGRDWNVATNLVIQDRAALQVMGTWAKGEFIAAGKAVGRDFECLPAPGNAQAAIVISDTLVVFRTHSQDVRRAQNLLIDTVMDPQVQSRYSRLAGSNPARLDVSGADFDPCAVRAESLIRGRDLLLPTRAMALPDALVGAIEDAITNAWNANQTPAAAAESLRRAIRASRL